MAEAHTAPKRAAAGGKPLQGKADLVALPEVLLVEGDAVGGLLGAIHIVESINVRLLDVPNAGLVDLPDHTEQIPCKGQELWLPW